MNHVIISGANGNLGRYVVRKFLDEGWHVEALVQPGTYMEDFEKYERLNVSMIDLNMESETAELVNFIYRRTGHLNACVMLAGGFAMSDFFNTDYELLQRMLHLNFFTAYNLVSSVFPLMTKQPEGGKMIFIGARPVLDCEAGKKSLAYTLSKSLLFKLSELLNAEGKNYKIGSVVLVPSIIDTPANRAAMPDADYSKWVKPEKLATIIFDNCGTSNVPGLNSVVEVYTNE